MTLTGMTRTARGINKRWKNWLLIGLASAFLSGCGGSEESTLSDPSAFTKAVPLQAGADTPLRSVDLQTARQVTATTSAWPTAIQLFDWAEATYPSVLPTSPQKPATQTYSTYQYRYYPSKDWILGVNQADESVVALLNVSTPTPSLIQLGSLSVFACAINPVNCPGPAGVAMVELSSSSQGELVASWFTAADDKTPSTDIRYQIHASTDPAFQPSNATLKFEGKGVTSAKVTTGLVGGQTYAVRLVALNASGASTTSLPQTVLISNTVVRMVSGVNVQSNQTTQVSSVGAASVTLNAGVPAPAVGSFIANPDANGGTGYLRKVVSTSTVGGATVVQTAPASVNETISDIQISSSFQLDAVPPATVARSVQRGLATVETSRGVPTQNTFNWPESGFRYTVGADPATDAASTSRERALATTPPTPTFSVSNSRDINRTHASLQVDTRVEMLEGNTGSYQPLVLLRNQSNVEFCGISVPPKFQGADRGSNTKIPTFAKGGLDTSELASRGYVVPEVKFTAP